MIEQLNVTGFIKDRLEMLVKDYEYYFARRDEIETKIAEIVLENRAMLALMQLPGIFHIAAFATQAVVEDAHRFPTASKLAAYGGFAMIGNTSGEEEERAQKRKASLVPISSRPSDSSAPLSGAMAPSRHPVAGASQGLVGKDETDCLTCVRV